MENESMIKISHLSKLYGIEKSEALSLLKKGVDKQTIHKKTGVAVALYDVNLEIPKGDIFVIIGLSGSGKSTLIRCLNRLNSATSGKIEMEGKDINALTPKGLRDLRQERLSMVFQSFGLFENRNILDNVCYGLEIKKIPRKEREEKGMKYIKMVGLEGYEKSRIQDLSGGMKQRVGIARALANETDIILMDEPFSALDPLVRSDMQFELLKLQSHLNKTIVFITHDIDEAFKLGDKVAIMKDGCVVQCDTPENMSAHPVDSYVEAFINSADRTKVLGVKNILLTPSSLVKQSDSPSYAVSVMKKKGFSTAYVVTGKLKVVGIVTLQEALRAKKEGLPLSDVVDKSLVMVREDALISDIILQSSRSPYPLAVVDGEQRLLGIVTKSGVLSSLAG